MLSSVGQEKRFIPSMPAQLWRFFEHAGENLFTSCGPYILTDKRNTTVNVCHVLRLAHKHELHKLTMTRILSQASRLFCRFCLPGMFANKHVYITKVVTIFFFLVIYRIF